MLTRSMTITRSATSITIMIDEQEILGASNNANDAPSLATARESGRARKPTIRLIESQQQEPLESLPKPTRRKRKANITVYEDQRTPPHTQDQS